ncbi:MAG: hypothetical protein K6T26_06875 [Alicyclobacillus sp.]|nr:hypothetical protein [Alicyclobacillus sp.]
MNWLDVLGAMWVMAVAGTAAVGGWSAVNHLLLRAHDQQVALTCAQDAAERWWSGQTSSDPLVTVSGQVCTVEVKLDVQNQEVSVRAASGQGQAVLVWPVP